MVFVFQFFKAVVADVLSADAMDVEYKLLRPGDGAASVTVGGGCGFVRHVL
jgi:hypothetical protein